MLSLGSKEIDVLNEVAAGAAFGVTRFSLEFLLLQTWVKTEVLSKEFWGWGQGSFKSIRGESAWAIAI